MYSDAVEMTPPAAGVREVARHPADKWDQFPFSEISHHGDACCDLAREWLSAMDFAQLNGANLASGPRWLRARYEWGPSRWPIHWCEALDRKVVDCGVHSALAHEVFLARGLTPLRAQIVQRYSPEAMSQWETKWVDEDASVHWLDDDVIYHEVNALLLAPDTVKLWDGSAGSWIDPRQGNGYGSVLAVRIFAPGHSSAEALSWGAHRIEPNRWYALEAPPVHGASQDSSVRMRRGAR